MILTGAGQIGMAIARRMGYGMKIVVGEFNGPRGDFYKNMFAMCPAGRPGTPDEVANVAELIMRPQEAFITGADFLMGGGATASYFYEPLNPNK